MFVEITRLFTVLVCTASGFIIGADISSKGQVVAGIGGILGCLIGYLGGGLLGRSVVRGVNVVERRVESVPISQVIAGVVGGGIGALLGLMVAIPATIYLRPQVALPIAALALWLFIYTGFRICAQKSEELFAMAGLSSSPLVRARPYEDAEGCLVDSSAVMDGQLLALARSGLFHDDLFVARFILDELQGMADAKDERGRRARNGLEVIEALRSETSISVYVLEDALPEILEVDAKLISLAKRLKLRLLTNDVNLARNAEIQGVLAVIPRKLAMDMQPGVAAGEKIRVSLTLKGRHEGQGVGYLDDGSMVVANDAADLVGTGEVELVVSSIVPTNAGRLVFVRKEGSEIEPADPQTLAEV